MLVAAKSQNQKNTTFLSYSASYKYNEIVSRRSNFRNGAVMQADKFEQTKIIPSIYTSKQAIKSDNKKNNNVIITQPRVISWVILCTNPCAKCNYIFVRNHRALKWRRFFLLLHSFPSRLPPTQLH